MALSSIGLLAGGTTSTTGGTAFTLTLDGQPVTSGVHVSDAAVADARIRPNATFKNKTATLLDASKNTWSKGKRSMVFTRPKVLAAGNIVFPLIRIEVEDHPEMSAAEILALVNQGAQSLSDTDTASFWATGNLA